MACSNTIKAADAQGAPTRYLVLYYSQTGVTRAVAQQLQEALGADIEAIEAVEPYSGTYDETIQRGLYEMQNGINPAIRPLQSRIADYDVVFIGYPIWFGTFPGPIRTLLANESFDGRRVVTFSTFGSGGLEASTADMQRALPRADVVSGYGVRDCRLDAVPRELHRFLVEGGYIAGEVTPLPPFGAMQPVDDTTKAIFDAACGNYPFPLGKPLSVARRDVETGTEYRFEAIGADDQGHETRSTIYILDGPDTTPIFTRVVR